MSKSLSVIIPVGPNDSVPHALLKTLAQSLPGADLIVAAGKHACSPTPAIPARFVESDWGRSVQMNSAAKQARGNWLWFVHADSQFPEETLRRVAEIVDKNDHSPRLHFFRLKFEKRKSGARTALLTLTELGTRLRSGTLGMPFGDQALLLPASLFQTLGGYRQDVAYGEDHLLVWTARRAGVPLVAEPFVVVTSPRKYLSNGWWRTTANHFVGTWTQASTEILSLLREHPALRDKVGLAIFVKTPELSPVKTRLAKDKGKAFALQFYEASLEALTDLGLILHSAGISTYWAVAEAKNDAHARWKHFELLPQGDGDLGARLHTIYSQLMRQHRVAILIGADSPQLQVADFQLTLQRLLNSDFVIGPATDGGFYLFAGKKPLPESVWRQVRYSESTTCEDLTQLLQPLGNVAVLPTRTDVDQAQDLSLLKQELEEGLSAVSSPARQKLLQLLSS